MFSALLLKILPFKWWLLGAAALAIALVIGKQYVQIQHLTATVATNKSAYDAERVKAAAAALQESERQRALEDQRAKAQREAEDEATHLVAIAQVDRDAARAAAGSLQQRYAAALAALRQAGRNPAPVGGRAPTEDDVAALLADMQRRVGEAAGEFAATADTARIAGLTCEREYDSLKP